MMIIDSQVHAYEANTPKRPWLSVRNWPASATGDETVALMDKLGIDGAIFISAFSLYRYDASYAVEVQRKHPGRFAIVKPVDPDDPAVAEVIADWKKTPGTVGIRIMLTKEPGRDRSPTDPGLDRILRAAVRHDSWVNVCPAERVFRADLERNRGNGRSLFGLMGALTSQNRPDEAVPLEALEGRVDLADIDFPGPTEHRLKAVLHLISMERLPFEEPQHAVLKRQSFV